jgi:hypothetical protein
METRRIIIEKENITRVIQMTFESGVLSVAEVTENSDNIEIVTVFLVQPHENDPDGSRSAWTSAEHAFTWFETRASEIV